MVRVEILRSDCQHLQDKINTFIKDKKVIDIKYQALAVPTEYEGNTPTLHSFYDSALIIYEGDITE